MTFTDLYDNARALAPNLRAEILDGDIVASPSPKPAHQAVALALASQLHSRFGRRPGGWFFLTDSDIRLGDDLVRPDLAGWRRSRLDTAPAETPITLAPDWVCEIVSPGRANERRDYEIKPAIYGEHGVTWLWQIDLRIPCRIFVLQWKCDATSDGTGNPASWSGEWVQITTVRDLRTARTLPPFDDEIDVAALFEDLGQ